MGKHIVETKWYSIRQNNSGGYFSPPADTIWVEAMSQDDAMDRFMDTDPDTYFCSCCGERWGEGYDEPREEMSREIAEKILAGKPGEWKSLFRTSIHVMPYDGEAYTVGEFKR